MRLTQSLFKTIRRPASEVLRSAEQKLAAASAGTGESAAATTSESSAFFDELPPILKNFFKKYPPAPFRSYATESRPTNAPDANPFLANKHPVTQAWHKPQYSMRRQADLWKAAYRFGIQHLLPKLLHDRKFYEERYAAGTEAIRGAHQFKLTRKERRAPARAKEVAEAVAQLDDKILERKGKRFAKYLQEKDRVGHV